jgi:hypothetical protein
MYKDKEKQREATRERVRRYRNKGATPDVTPNGTPNVTLLKRPNRLGKNGLPEMVENEYDPLEKLEDGTPRYMGPLSDGQVLDRLSVLESMKVRGLNAQSL